MDTNNTLKTLCKLAQLDVDAVHAYAKALKSIDKPDIFQKIEQFKNDHIRHIDDLNHLITQLGGERVSYSQDFKGYIIEGLTSLRSLTGTIGALKAMQTNENLTNKTYADALKSNDLSQDAISLIQKNYNDEKRHLEFIQSSLQQFKEKAV